MTHLLSFGGRACVFGEFAAYEGCLVEKNSYWGQRGEGRGGGGRSVLDMHPFLPSASYVARILMHGGLRWQEVHPLWQGVGAPGQEALLHTELTEQSALSR